MESEFKDTYFQKPNWYKALTLSERSSSLSDGFDRLLAPSDNAEKRLARWRAQPPFTDESIFEKRLIGDHLSESALLYLLSETPKMLAERLTVRPAWLVNLERAFAEYESRVSKDGDTNRPDSKNFELKDGDGYLVGMAPVINEGVQRVLAGIKLLQQGGSHLPFDPETVIGLLLPSLLMKLINQSTRSLVLELNIARLQGTLVGETPEERFTYFRNLLKSPDFLIPILLDYPVLTRQAVIAVDYWANNCLDLLGRLTNDWEEIVSTLSPESDPGLLVALSGEAGDSHRRGRAVKILKFSNDFELVYKPHSLSVDVHFGELLEWLNERGDHPRFSVLKVIDRNDYGWVEFVPLNGCTQKEEVQRFYHRQGGLLALLYALEATDFHLENLIASGEHPYLVDLESLFHPRVRNVSGDRQPIALATDEISHSVLRIGLLPQRIWAADDNKEGVDLSGLGGAAGQLTPFPVLSYENLATDEMKVVRKRLEMQGSQNRPKFEGQDVNLQDYTQDIIDGFTTVYKLLLREREDLLADDGPLMRFAEDEVRAVLRATRTYGALLTESFHPDVLGDALDRNRLFDRIWNWSGHSPDLYRVIPAEVRDLEGGDVPFFSCRPNSCDVWTSDGERISDFFEETSLAAVSRRLRQLNEEDLVRQVWFISASIASMTLGVEQKKLVGFQLEPSASQAGRDRLLCAARKLGDRLESLALQDETNVNWIGLTFVGGRNWTLLPLLDDLYNGTQGVALALAYLGDVLEEERFNALARKVAANVSTRIKMLVENRDTVKKEDIGRGGYSGVGAAIYTFAHLGSLWKEPSYFTLAESLNELLPDLIENDKALDVIGGSAGCILNLLALYQCNSSERVLAVARQCGDRLVEHATTFEDGVGWETEMLADKPLTGFSHGAAGIAHALLELAAVTGDEKYRKTAFDAFAYERSVFSEAEGNWPDFRNERGQSEQRESEGDSFMVAWCHGAPGGGFGRLRAFAQTGDERLRHEIDVAIKTTFERGFGMNHSICHGDLGNLDFLLEAARTLNDPTLLSGVGRLADSILNSIDVYGWMCGTPRGAETPGLMTGLAGIGYELLRLAEPERVPSLLLLAPPPAVAKESKLMSLVEVA